MKRHFLITVGGQTFEVAVEEKATPTVSEGTVEAARQVSNSAQTQGNTGSGLNGLSQGKAAKAPMAGKIMSVLVQEGESVKRGDPLLVLDAMKMENDIVSPQDGTVMKVLVGVDQSVEAGQDLVLIN